MEIVETVIILGRCGLLLFGGNRFLKLTFLVFGVQNTDILQRMYIFLFPAREYFICILETWLSGSENCPARYQPDYGR